MDLSLVDQMLQKLDKIIQRREMSYLLIQQDINELKRELQGYRSKLVNCYEYENKNDCYNSLNKRKLSNVDF